MAKAKPAPKKKAAKKAAAKKPAAKRTAKPKLPFYATLLSKQDASGLKATNKNNDSMQTDKFPNDDADVIYKGAAGKAYSFPGAMTGKKKDQVVVTLKYPSDTDEDVTQKFPSDSDEHITKKFPSDMDEPSHTLKYPSDNDEDVEMMTEASMANLQTARYPNDEYAVAVDALANYKPPKGAVSVRTAIGKDSLQTLKYPSDKDEHIHTLKYPSDTDEVVDA